jgi:hypothetical protein
MTQALRRGVEISATRLGILQLIAIANNERAPVSDCVNDANFAVQFTATDYVPELIALAPASIFLIELVLKKLLRIVTPF